MKRVFNSFSYPRTTTPVLFSILLLAAAVSPAFGQAGADSANPEANTVQARIERARALAAAHQLGAAARELETLRNSGTDDVVRNVTSVMLMNICLEEGNYARAGSLLEETFAARSSNRDSSIRTYFALAGQAVNSVRSHLARYRSFGINVSDPSLPTEALNDLDRLRSLLERMSAQAKEIIKDAPKANESLALLEDIAGIRLSLSRDEEDSAKWEIERANARRGLISTQTEIASLVTTPAGVVATETASAPIQNGTQNTLQNSAPAQPQSSAPTVAKAAETSAPSSTTANDAPAHGIVESGPLNLRAIRRVVPIYPQIAKNAYAQGVVRVYVTIDENGNVSSVARSEGPPLLRGAAEDAARRWKFSPSAIDGKPVRQSGYIEFNFTL